MYRLNRNDQAINFGGQSEQPEIFERISMLLSNQPSIATWDNAAQRPSTALQSRPNRFSRKKSKMLQHLCSDLFSILLCQLLSVLLILQMDQQAPLRFTGTELFSEKVSGAEQLKFFLFCSLMSAALIIFSLKAGHYTRFKGFWEEFGQLLNFSAGTAALLALALVFAGYLTPLLPLAVVWFLTIIVVPLNRCLLKLYAMKKGRWFTPVLIIGTGRNALETALAIESNALMGFRVAGIVDLRERARPGRQHPGNDMLEIYDPLGCKMQRFKHLYLDDLERDQRFADIRSHYIILALEHDEYASYDKIIDIVSSNRKNISIIPPLRGLPLAGSEISPIFRHEILQIRVNNNMASGSSKTVKRVFDIMISSLLLLTLAPLFLVLAGLIKSDGGPVFYFQNRVGRGNKPFKCWKFRSMHQNAEARLEELLDNNPDLRMEYLQTEKLKDDPRITSIGKFIRASSIDELPQLWNVLKGEMSMVGPRPVKASELRRYGYFEKYYLESLPGITGLWQISGRNDVKYETRVDLDSWYARNWSLWCDITILAKTVSVVFKREGAY